MSKIAEVCSFLDVFAPRRLAAEWDNVGLLMGDRTGPCERVLTCLTVTPESADEAIARRAELIVTHHPVLFRPTKRLTADSPEGAMLWRLARAGVAVYSPHTAFDNTSRGINARLAELLDLRDVVPLRKSTPAGSCKVVVFVPVKDLDAVASALFKAGAGQIGNYQECSFRLEGTGTFFGNDAANPSVGQKGRREEVREFRLEAVCPLDRVDAVIAAMRRSHSYEEPAYDVYPLSGPPSKEGEGRLGLLSAAITLGEFAALVKQKLRSRLVELAGDPRRGVRKVALACGAAGEFQRDAIRAGADVFLTGEARFHDCLAARASGIGLVLAGHYATERFAVEELAQAIKQEFDELEVWASERESDPLISV
jgi:dinuclear metal center YbgI/SA1388 family protein